MRYIQEINGLVTLEGDDGSTTFFDPNSPTQASKEYAAHVARGGIVEIRPPVVIPPIKPDKVQRLIALLLQKGVISPSDVADLETEKANAGLVR